MVAKKFFQYILALVIITGIVLLVIIKFLGLEEEKIIFIPNYDNDNNLKLVSDYNSSLVVENVGQNSVELFSKCEKNKLKNYVEQRGDFYVFYNYVTAEEQFDCLETITYTTQGDFTFLDNLIILVEAWQGPISVSLYTPGDDFKNTIKSIAYLRNCETPLIRKYVTFHLFFEKKYTPKGFKVPLYDPNEIYSDEYDCVSDPPFKKIAHDKIYKSKHNLTYPINVARNSARIAAQTHYVLASDMELIPPPNFIPKFLNMIDKNREHFDNITRKVFVLPVFELEENAKIPKCKTELLEMIENSTAFLFHEKLCRRCHEVQNYTEWLEEPEKEELDVLAVGKRMYNYKSLEAFYVGTNDDPLFDERLTWEGQKNKMTQAYIMCLLDYDYMILDNAFLVHRPGIKKEKVQMTQYKSLVKKTATLVKKVITPELKILYGKRLGC